VYLHGEPTMQLHVLAFLAWYVVRVCAFMSVIKDTTGKKIKKGTLLWVNTRVGTASCGLVLEPGSSYILYPDVDEGSLGLKLGSNLCLTSGLRSSTCRPTVGPGPTRRQIRGVKRAC
jgi:hypothetical protein